MNESAKRIVQDGPSSGPGKVALIMWLVPWIPLVLTLWLTPDYITPFFKIPIALKMMIAFAMWQALCCILMARTTNNIHRFLLIAVSAPPIIGMVMLGPAIGVIFRALEDNFH